MRTLTESIFWMVLMMLCVVVELLTFPMMTQRWIAYIAIPMGIIGTIFYYHRAKQAERTLRRRTDIKITIEHKDDTDRPAPAEQ